jgi:hypothetical protein
MPGPVPETPPGCCGVCGGPLRRDNRTGLCRRTAACNTERRRRGALRAAAPRCLCSHSRDRHENDGKCVTACGCDRYRRNPKAAAARGSAER